MNDKQIDKLIERALRDDASLPEGLSERLERRIDQLNTSDHGKHVRQVRMRALYWLTGVAAALLVGIAIFFQPSEEDIRITTADTFASPEEAAQAAQEALAFLSYQLNKGLEQVADAQSEVEKVNGIVSKQLTIDN